MGEWFPGKVVAVSSDGGLSYSIDYADGDKETGVLPKYVRPLVTGAAAAVPKAAEAKQARAEAKPSGEDGQRCGGGQSSGVGVVSSGGVPSSGGGQSSGGGESKRPAPLTAGGSGGPITGCAALEGAE